MLRMLIGLCALCALSFAACAAAQVYKWTDAGGVVHFSDTPPANGTAATVAIDPYASPSGADSPARQPLSIEMYATASCPYCRCAREVFQRHGVRWRELDIEKSAAANREFRRRGGRGVPLIYVNGERHDGCHRERLSSALARYGY